MLKKFIEFIKSLLGLDKDNDMTPPISPRPKGINQLLLDELKEQFEKGMDTLSVTSDVGTQIIYPMSFNILMCPNDYNEVKESLGLLIPTIIGNFYVKIREKIKSSNNVTDYTNAATYWFFQFSGCEITQNKDGLTQNIKQGTFITTTSLYAVDIRKVIDNDSVEANKILSIKAPQSDVQKYNVNEEILRGVDILAEGTYKYRFDNKLNKDPRVIQSHSAEKKLATLRCTNLAKDVPPYTMYDDYIDIVGSTNNKLKGTNTYHIQNDAVATPHLSIRYDHETQTFKLAAYAKTLLNETNVKLSGSGNQPDWVDLPNNSELVLNDSVIIRFNACS